MTKQVQKSLWCYAATHDWFPASHAYNLLISITPVSKLGKCITGLLVALDVYGGGKKGGKFSVNVKKMKVN